MNQPTGKPLRVLYVARAPFVSGAERALLSMLKHLDRSRVAAGVILGHKLNYEEQVRKLNVPVWGVPWAKREPTHPLEFFRWMKSVSGLKRVVDEFKPDLIHANDVPSCQAMSVVGAKRNIPRVVHVRWTITAKEASWWVRDGADGVICISQWIRDQLGHCAETTLEKSHIEVIPDCVNWAGAKDQTIDDRTKPNVGEPISIGFAGQLIPSKGLELVIRAMGQLPINARPRLIIAGRDSQTKGAYEDQLRRLANEVGVASNIEWVGFLDDVKALYGRVSAMVCPSLEEPLGLVPLEAAEFAIPTIANRVGGLAETIVDGQSGWLVAPEVDAWAKALSRLTDRAALARMGKAAWVRTREHYSPMVYQRKLLELYETLTGWH